MYTNFPNCKEYKFSSHAIQRMFERSINPNDLITGLACGEIIQNYSNDKPFPSILILLNLHKRSLHVVLAINEAEGICYIITVYEPDKKIWEKNLRNRRKK